MKTPPPLPGAKPPGWMGQNWMWLVPLIALLGLAGIAGIVALLTMAIKSSDAYSGAVARANSNPAVIAAMGTPIKDGLFFSGVISETGSSGRAHLIIPMTGPRATANLYVTATRTSGVWHFDNLRLQVDTPRQQIDLLNTNE